MNNPIRSVSNPKGNITAEPIDAKRFYGYTLLAND